MRTEFLEYSRFTTKFGNDINFLEYFGMIEAIKKYKESLHLKDEPSKIQPKQSRM